MLASLKFLLRHAGNILPAVSCFGLVQGMIGLALRNGSVLFLKWFKGYQQGFFRAQVEGLNSLQ